MKPQASRLLEQALKLPPEARAALAGSLIESLDDQVDPEAEAAWKAEISRRIRELDTGRVRPVKWSSVRRALRGR